MKTQVERKEKNIAVSVVVVLSVLSLILTSVHVSYAQQQQQVESDGGLTVTLNGDTFRRGDEIMVTGTVEDREIGSNAVIEVINPLGERVEYTFPRITADNTFFYSFEAGEAEEVFSQPMEVTGNYRMEVRYTTPDREREEVEFVFAFVGDEEIEEEGIEEIEEAVDSAAVINITAVNQTAAQAIDILQTLNETLTVENSDDIVLSAEDIRLYLSTTQNLLMDIQGNLTLTAVESSGGINIDSNTSPETRGPSPPPTQQEQQPSPPPQSEQPVL